MKDTEDEKEEFKNPCTPSAVRYIQSLTPERLDNMLKAIDECILKLKDDDVEEEREEAMYIREVLYRLLNNKGLSEIDIISLAWFIFSSLQMPLMSKLTFEQIEKCIDTPFILAKTSGAIH